MKRPGLDVAVMVLRIPKYSPVADVPASERGKGQVARVYREERRNPGGQWRRFSPYPGLSWRALRPTGGPQADNQSAAQN